MKIMETITKIQTQSRTPTPTDQRTPNKTTNNHHVNNMKRSSSSNSDSHHHHHQESFHSPLRSNSPLKSDDPDPDPNSLPTPYASPSASPLKSPWNNPPERQNSKAIVTVTQPLPPAPEKAVGPEVTMNSLMGESMPAMTKVGPGGEGRSDGAVASILNRSRTADMMKIANLGFRLSEVVLCLISFSVMAADKTQGWAGDSFDRYREYRYCLSINVIGFVYSAFQAYDVGYYISTGKHVIRHHLRRPFDFFMDQILAYLLISAASAAATRVDDWQTNWGKDDFTVMASASVAMAFLAFMAFACSSLISGYNVCTM